MSFCSPLELELSPVTCSSTLAADTTSLLLANVTSSAESAVTTDVLSSVIKRPVEDEEEEELNRADVSPAYKVLKLADSVPTTAAGHVKPGTCMSTVFHCNAKSTSLHLCNQNFPFIHFVSVIVATI